MPWLVWRAAKANWEEYLAVREESKEHGIVWADPGNAYRDHIAQHRTTEKQRVIANATEQGIDKADAYVSALEENMRWWNAWVAENGTDEGAYVAALKERVYDKVEF